MRFVRAFLLLVALQSPALAQTDGASLAAGAKVAADQLQLYLDDVAKAGGRPDFGKPPAAELFARIFDFEHLQALPPPQGNDLPWLLDWADAANKVNKAIMFFGIKRPADAAAHRVRPRSDQRRPGETVTPGEDERPHPGHWSAGGGSQCRTGND